MGISWVLFHVIAAFFQGPKYNQLILGPQLMTKSNSYGTHIFRENVMFSKFKICKKFKSKVATNRFSENSL